MKIGFSTQLGKDLIKDISFAEKNKFNVLCLELSWEVNLNFSLEEILKLKDLKLKKPELTSF